MRLRARRRASLPEPRRVPKLLAPPLPRPPTPLRTPQVMLWVLSPTPPLASSQALLRVLVRPVRPSRTPVRLRLTLQLTRALLWPVLRQALPPVQRQLLRLPAALWVLPAPLLPMPLAMRVPRLLMLPRVPLQELLLALPPLPMPLHRLVVRQLMQWAMQPALPWTPRLALPPAPSLELVLPVRLLPRLLARQWTRPALLSLLRLVLQVLWLAVLKRPHLARLLLQKGRWARWVTLLRPLQVPLQVPLPACARQVVLPPQPVRMQLVPSALPRAMRPVQWVTRLGLLVTLCLVLQALSRAVHRAKPWLARRDPLLTLWGPPPTLSATRQVLTAPTCLLVPAPALR